MAQRTEVILTDDIDGGSADETISFALDGKKYEIDLSNKHADKFRKAIGGYVQHARKSDGTRLRRTSTGAGRDPEQTKAIRDWAKGQGLTVSDRGRISAEIADAYEAAH